MPPTSQKNPSTLLLIALTLAVAVLYFRIVQSLILPLMLACVVAVLFFPVYCRVRRICFDHYRIAAALTTVFILIGVLFPIAGVISMAGMKIVGATEEITDELNLTAEAEQLMNGAAGERPLWMRELRSRFTRKEIDHARRMASDGLGAAAEVVYEKTIQFVANVFSFVVGLGVFLLALYYFLAENERMLGEIERLSPLAPEDDRALWENFVHVCRGVLMGTVFAAVVQAVLNGVGFALLGVGQPLLLGLTTFFLALVPFVGAGAVWGCVAILLVWEGEYGKAGILVVYGLAIVSTVDNLIRAHALHDNGRLHPLVALVSILGALQFVGLWGIVVGPVVAAFFYSLLQILHHRTDGKPPQLEIPP